jgi:serine/threonine protein kinase
MREKPAQNIMCPYCGFSEEKEPQDIQKLDYWTVLKGKYLVGKCLGQGGFGITYVGFDMDLELKVAVKEYFPSDYAFRNHRESSHVYIHADGMEEIFEEEKKRFIEEARILAQLDELPGIVTVRDYFQENGTSYIAMEYVEGDTLLEYLRKNGGVLPASRVLAMMEPVIKSMIRIHDKGVIHKDISPDNIMITADNRVKLIDFGAADRNFGNSSYQVYKERYSPPEQRTDSGKVGTWSDIYAFCATMYYCMTGHLPESVPERLRGEELLAPSYYGAEISPVQEAALMKGLALEAEERIRDARDLYYFLYMYGQESTSSGKLRKEIEKKKTDELIDKLKKNDGRRRQRMWLAVCSCVVVLLFGAHFVFISFEAGRSVSRAGANAETNIDTAALKQNFYEAAKELHTKKDAGKLNVSGELEKRAESFAKVLETASLAETKNGWEAVYERALAASQTESDTDVAAWMVIPVTESTKPDKVLQTGLSVESNEKSFLQCNNIGAAVTETGGYVFYVIFMSE